MPAIAFVGAATLDAIALVDDFPEPDERRVAEDLVHAGGGPAATAAVTAARLGVPSAFIGVVGADEAGGRIVDGLRAAGVDTSAVVVDPSVSSGASVCLADRVHATRAICSRQAPPPDLSTADSLLDTVEWVHVDHIGWSAVHTRLAAMHRPPALSVDAGNTIDDFDLSGTTLYVPTAESLRRRYRSDLDEALDCALAGGAETVVATMAARGSIAACADGTRHRAPGVDTDVVSTLGAGDVFHGALLAASVRGLPMQRRLEYANTVAALSCRGLDGRSAIPTDAEAQACIARAVKETTWPTI